MDLSATDDDAVGHATAPERVQVLGAKSATAAANCASLSQMAQKQVSSYKMGCQLPRRSKALIIEALLEATQAERVLWRASAAMLSEEGMGSGPHVPAADTGIEACSYTSK